MGAMRRDMAMSAASLLTAAASKSARGTAGPAADNEWLVDVGIIKAAGPGAGGIGDVGTLLTTEQVKGATQEWASRNAKWAVCDTTGVFNQPAARSAAGPTVASPGDDSMLLSPVPLRLRKSSTVTPPPAPAPAPTTTAPSGVASPGTPQAAVTSPAPPGTPTAAVARARSRLSEPATMLEGLRVDTAAAATPTLAGPGRDSPVLGRVASMAAMHNPGTPAPGPAGSTIRQEVRCPPGSPAEWHFQESALAPGSVRLESVQFELQLMPSRSAGEPMPPHLFAMLARSSAGVRCMQRMSVVSTVWDDAFERSVTPLQRRAALLSLAHTASTKRGYVYMLSLFPGFPLRMDELARSAEDLSIRGTAMYVVRLLCQVPEARADFEALGWSTSPSSGVVVPDTPTVVLAGLTDAPLTAEHVAAPPLPNTLAGAEKKCYDLVASLFCRIQQSETKSSLADLRKSNPEVFSSVPLFLAICDLLEVYEYPLSSRRLLHALFDKVSIADPAAWARARSRSASSAAGR